MALIASYKENLYMIFKGYKQVKAELQLVLCMPWLKEE
jgi:hypothetical protein